jgi:hypothetical protein
MERTFQEQTEAIRGIDLTRFNAFWHALGKYATKPTKIKGEHTPMIAPARGEKPTLLYGAWFPDDLGLAVFKRAGKFQCASNRIHLTSQSLAIISMLDTNKISGNTTIGRSTGSLNTSFDESFTPKKQREFTYLLDITGQAMVSNYHDQADTKEDLTLRTIGVYKDLGSPLVRFFQEPGLIIPKTEKFETIYTPRMSTMGFGGVIMDGEGGMPTVHEYDFQTQLPADSRIWLI